MRARRRAPSGWPACPARSSQVGRPSRRAGAVAAAWSASQVGAAGDQVADRLVHRQHAAGQRAVLEARRAVDDLDPAVAEPVVARAPIAASTASVTRQ